jgi:hypothetical protein
MMAIDTSWMVMAARPSDRRMTGVATVSTVPSSRQVLVKRRVGTTARTTEARVAT